MTVSKNSQLLKVSLVIYVIVCLVYGLGFMFLPDFLVRLSGSDPVFHGWLRWSGGLLVALCIGTFLVYRKPEGQGIFVTTIALGSTLCCLAMFYAWATLEEGVNVWFTALPAIILLIVAILLWWSRQKAKDILFP